MPPKGRKSKKSKQQEVPLVCPESRDADEKETAMLWDRVAPLGPNPLSLTGADYSFSTNRGFQSGGFHNSIVGMASPTVPLIAPPADRFLQRFHSIDASATNNSFSGGDHSAPMVPKPPPRHLPPNARLVQKLQVAEHDMRQAQEVHDALLADKSGFDFMMKHEVAQLSGEREALQKEIQELEERLREEEVKQIQELDDMQHEHNQDVAELEALMDELVAGDEKVQQDLAEKRETQSAIQEKERALEELTYRNEQAIKRYTKELQAEREKLAETMTQRLKKTADDMAKLTAAQKEQRQQRAVSESDRRVSELALLERRSRLLNEKNAKLTMEAALSKRDRSIEQYRRELLLAKNAKVNHSVKGVVQQLQELEHHFAEKANKGTEHHGGAITTEVVDRQYEMIIHLRSELEQVRRETDELEGQARMLQRQAIESTAAKYLQVRIPPSATLTAPSKLLTTSSVGADRLKGLDPESVAACRTTIIESFVEVNKALQAVPINGCANLLELRDPEERLKVQDYVAKRLNILFSNLYPTAPPAKFLEAASAMD